MESCKEVKRWRAAYWKPGEGGVMEGWRGKSERGCETDGI